MADLADHAGVTDLHWISPIAFPKLSPVFKSFGRPQGLVKAIVFRGKPCADLSRMAAHFATCAHSHEWPAEAPSSIAQFRAGQGGGLHEIVQPESHRRYRFRSHAVGGAALIACGVVPLASAHVARDAHPKSTISWAWRGRY